ncbi:MAG: hypothetical protein NC048_02780 [Bacteroides sp.]|nr:hypothetical protein [Bacteroides sp.]MCM1531435.1 hypothetical protein [Ruminococcus flavefaciens]MCM1554403.1 hypothetical protein [Bacteroides sp.]
MQDFRLGENFSKFGATYTVCGGGDCRRCAFHQQKAICYRMACRSTERRDRKDVHFAGLPLAPGLLSATATSTVTVSTNEHSFNLKKQ